ncbi:MAG TPA: hypothetical protein VJG67_02710 [Candidatus Paceibacterota bacterium]
MSQEDSPIINSQEDHNPQSKLREMLALSNEEIISRQDRDLITNPEYKPPRIIEVQGGREELNSLLDEWKAEIAQLVADKSTYTRNALIAICVKYDRKITELGLRLTGQTSTSHELDSIRQWSTIIMFISREL